MCIRDSLHPTTQVPEGERFGWGLEIRPIHYFKTPDTPEVAWEPPASQAAVAHSRGGFR